VDRQCPSCGGFCKKSGCERENTKPEREWAGLTDADKEVLLANLYESVEGLITAIEAKLKDKNGW
jgi:hypothetical protein